MKHFYFQNPSNIFKYLYITKDKKENYKLEYVFKSGLKD